MNTTEKRLALVIGNSNYGTGDEVSGVENAKAMAECLEKRLGFTVKPPVLNANRETIWREVKTFSEQIRDADVVLFFYSGHGVQLEGTNYLIPIDGSVNPERSVRLDDILQKLATAPAKAIKFAFLDACREIQGLPEDAPKGFTNPPPAPPNTLIAYAASPNQPAESGLPTERSVYTRALLKYLPISGLELADLFVKVRADVFQFSDGQQTFEADTLSQDFYFRPPVFVQAQTFGWPHNRVLGFLNGELALSEEQESVTDLRLDAERENHLAFMVSHAKNYHNDQIWGRTQGWSYKLDLLIPGNGATAAQTVPFEDREDVPFKDGPHHGQTFTVAESTLVVDPQSAAVTVTRLETDVAHREIPFWAQDQEILFQEKLVNLPLSAVELLGGSLNFGLTPLLIPFLDDFLKTGKVLDTVVVDPDKSYVAVRGNKALRDVVQHCMTVEWPDRVRDLRASFTAFFKDRHPRPFDVFAEGLDASVRARAASVGFPAKPEDLKVWTSLDDLSPEALANEAQPGSPAAEDVPESLPEATLQALAGSILQPQPGEALIDSRIVEQTVQGVALKAQVYTFLSVKPVDAQIQLHARVIADLSDLQNKIGALIDTIPLPTDNCARFSADNLVARIWGKQITVDGNTATLTLNGNVEVWTCLEIPFGLPPFKTRNLSQSFDAALPFQVEVVGPQSYALKLGDPSVDLGGPLGGVTEGILRIAGVDINAKVKEALNRALNPGALQQTLPDFVLKYNPTLTRAELLSNSGALALRLEVDATLNIWQLAELIRDLISSR